MAVLCEEATGRLSSLEAHHLVGRSHRSSLRLTDASVSGEHASLRWTGRSWVVRDLGSRYGTFLNAQPLKAGVPMPIARGGKLAFGRERSTWILTSDEAPDVMVMPVGGGEGLRSEGGMIAVPSIERPTAAVFQGRDGRWILDQNGQADFIQEHTPFQVEGRSWWLCNSSPMHSTSMSGEGRETMSLDEVQLRFRVTMNEEHVEIYSRWRERNLELGSRAHYYVLLTLARIRLADAERGEPITRAGWVDQEQLLRQLHAGPEKLNLDIFRVRRQFGEHGFTPAAGIVERRPGAKELRIGVADLRIERV